MHPGNGQQRAVRIRLHHPPTSLRFEAFSGEVCKLRACSGDAHAPSSPESADMAACRLTSIFSLWASNSVPMPAVGERNVRAGTTDSASDATAPRSALGNLPQESRRGHHRCDASLARLGLAVIETPVRSPKSNSLCERLIGTRSSRVVAGPVLNGLHHEYNLLARAA